MRRFHTGVFSSRRITSIFDIFGIGVVTGCRERNAKSTQSIQPQTFAASETVSYRALLCPAISCPAISCPAIWSVNFTSVIFTSSIFSAPFLRYHAVCLSVRRPSIRPSVFNVEEPWPIGWVTSKISTRTISVEFFTLRSLKVGSPVQGEYLRILRKLLLSVQARMWLWFHWFVISI